MATVKKCDMCEKIVTGEDRAFKTPDGFIVNAIRLGHWDQRKKEWVSIASGYDLCESCASKLYDLVCGNGSSIVMRKKNNPVKPYSRRINYSMDDNKAPEENAAVDLEAAQHEFAKSEEDNA